MKSHAFYVVFKPTGWAPNLVRVVLNFGLGLLGDDVETTIYTGENRPNMYAIGEPRQLKTYFPAPLCRSLAVERGFWDFVRECSASGMTIQCFVRDDNQLYLLLLETTIDCLCQITAELISRLSLALSPVSGSNKRI